MGRGGFEPPKAEPTDLQSVPFGHSGTSPKFWEKRDPIKPVKHLTLNLQRSTLEALSNQSFKSGAGKGTRTPDLLITNQLLYQLSYASSANKNPNSTPRFPKLQLKLEVLSYKISNYWIFLRQGDYGRHYSTTYYLLHKKKPCLYNKCPILA